MEGEKAWLIKEKKMEGDREKEIKKKIYIRIGN